MSCIFCKIGSKEIPSQTVFENEDIIAFKDLNPQAPVHILVIPKKHISSINELNSENSFIVAKIFEAITEIVKNEGIKESGYRVISNCGEDGCQSVEHLHFHIVGGKNCQKLYHKTVAFNYSMLYNK